MGKSDPEKTKVSSKSKKEKLVFPTKVVIRRLPPGLKEEQLKECIGTLPEFDFFYFVEGRLSFDPVPFSRAYINFVNPDDIVQFRDQFDGCVFTDERGHHYPAVVEYAPYQGTPRRKNRKDTKCNTIEQDKDYIAFLESLEKEVEALPSIETHLEELEAKKDKSEAKKTTPLLEYVKIKRNNRERARLENRKKRQEKEEAPKNLKKNSHAAKDAKVSNPREEKIKNGKKTDGRDTGRRDQGRREETKKPRDSKTDHSYDKDLKPPRNQRDKEQKVRPDSSRPNSRADDRRHVNRRERQDSDRRDNVDKGHNERGRRYNDRFTEERHENQPSEAKSSSTSPKEIPSKAKDGSPPKHLPDKETEKNKDKEKEKTLTRSRDREREREREANRLKNKDRPDRAIYQPRSRAPRLENAEQGKSETKVSLDKVTGEDKDKEKRESKDNIEKKRERNRDYRRGGRDRGERRDRDLDRSRKKDRHDMDLKDSKYQGEKGNID